MAGRSVPLRAFFPDSFPRARPIVNLRGDPATFPTRHCSPIEGELCLLGRDTRQWRQKWTLAELLNQQLADALAGTGVEDPQGEPAEYWWNGFGLDNSYCLVDSSWTLGEATAGTIVLGFASKYRDGALRVAAFVREVRDTAGRCVCGWDGRLPGWLGQARTAQIPWAYVDKVLLPSADTADQLKELRASLPFAPPRLEIGYAASAQVFAITYRSELLHLTEGLGWLFPIYWGPNKAFRPPKRNHAPTSPAINVLATMRAGSEDLGARVPAVGVLRDKTVAVIGVGAIGAPVATELARAGCRQLHLVDHDKVEPGNSIRWPLGSSAWGRKKALALAESLSTEYPWSIVTAHTHAIGTFDGPNVSKGDDALFTAALEGVDLVVDASASYSVRTILGDLCRERRVPLVALYATPPVTGGVVARFAPASGCPTCLESAYHQNAFARPPGDGDESGLQQPPGCAERTFTGASFDLQELSLQAVRLVVATLTNPQESADSVVHTLDLDRAAGRVAPSWRVDLLPKAAGCTCNPI